MFDRILVPLDGTTESAIALPVACALAQAYHSQLVLFRIVDTTAKRYDAKNDLERIAGEYASSAFPVSSEVWIASDVAAQTAWAVAEGLGDLVVMASRRCGGAGSVADSVVARSRVPVLVVPIAESPADRIETRALALTTAVEGAAWVRGIHAPGALSAGPVRLVSDV